MSIRRHDIRIGKPAAKSRGLSGGDLLDVPAGTGWREIRAVVNLLLHPRGHEGRGSDDSDQSGVRTQLLTNLTKARQKLAVAKVVDTTDFVTGAVEQGEKLLASRGSRLMRWAEAGGQAILTLRSLLQSDRFDRGWSLLLATYKARVTVPENVVRFLSDGHVSA